MLILDEPWNPVHNAQVGPLSDRGGEYLINPGAFWWTSCHMYDGVTSQQLFVHLEQKTMRFEVTAANLMQDTTRSQVPCSQASMS